MLEEILKLHTLTIHRGANLVRDNPHDVEEKELVGTCGGLPFPSDRIRIFPVGERDVAYLYHSRGSRLSDMGDNDYARIIGYILSGELELTNGARLNFKDLNPHHWQSGCGHSGTIMYLHLRYERIPDGQKANVAQACPVELPAEYTNE